MAKTDLTAELLHKFLHYDPETGDLIWKVSRGKARAGSRAIQIDKDGYRQVTLFGSKFFAHRLVWFYVHGVWPSDQIDHINGDILDNRMSNLREATGTQNMQNRKISTLNTSGYQGVTFNKNAGKWQTCIRDEGKQRYLGLFITAEEASAVYLAAKKKFHLFNPTCRYL